MNSPDVTAVVVTYRRPQDLARCLVCLADQTYPLAGIVVVDNASGDQATLDVLSSARNRYSIPIRVTTLERNIGGAGGFAAGLFQAAAAHPEHSVWLVDDDCFPEKDALEHLLAESDPTRITTSSVVRANGEGFDMVHRRRWKGLAEAPLPEAFCLQPRVHEIHTASFVSMLLPPGLIENIGVPFANYVIWCDDTEYSLRATRAGYSIWLVPRSRVIHGGSPAGGPALSSWSWKITFGLRNQTATYKMYMPMPKFWAWFARMNVVLLPNTLRMYGRSDALSHLGDTYRALYAGLRFRPGHESVALDEVQKRAA